MPPSAKQVLEATQQWLRPLIHVLLSCGITWREFAELSRTTYVQVASENFGKCGRPTNVSRTAILTGLARRDVRKQRQLLINARTMINPNVHLELDAAVKIEGQFDVNGVLIADHVQANSRGHVGSKGGP